MKPVPTTATAACLPESTHRCQVAIRARLDHPNSRGKQSCHSAACRRSCASCSFPEPVCLGRELWEGSLSVRNGIWGIVLAAGSGSRFGERKQFLRVADTRPVDLAVRATAHSCEGLVLVLPSGIFWEGEPVAEVVMGGETRIESARRGLEVVPPSAEIVVIHDAAHPLASQSIFESVIAAVREDGIDAAFPVVATKDTVMRVRQDRVVETVFREGLVNVQTPQAYKARVLRAAHERGGEASDDSVLVQGLGAVIKLVPGESINIHVTTEDDLAMVGRLLRAP